jgi:hypothetical protein
VARGRAVCDADSYTTGKDDMLAIIGNCITGILAFSLFAATLRLSR